MLAEAMLMAATVWYVPGWLRTHEVQDGVLPALSNAFPKAKLEFKSWDGDHVVWPTSVDSADKEAWRLAFEVATMPAAEREELTIVGHSLGGRITARVLARLAEKGLRVRQAVLLAAAIPYEDPDLAKMGAASRQPVLAVCNPDDSTLRYVYALAGGEKGAAFGANGTLRPIANVVESVTPKDITSRVKLDSAWAKSQMLKDIANHHVAFYLGHMAKVLAGEADAGGVMVPQDLPTIEHKVIDGGVWWDVVAETNGWRLERHKLTSHCRILSPDKVCRAWGGEEKMSAAFEKATAGQK